MHDFSNFAYLYGHGRVTQSITEEKIVEMRLLVIDSTLAACNSLKSWRSAKIHGGSAKVVNCVLSRWSSGHHVATPPVFDSKVGFTDYEKERREFNLEVPEYFNFANVIDDWAQKEKVGTYIPHIRTVFTNRSVSIILLMVNST